MSEFDALDFPAEPVASEVPGSGHAEATSSKAAPNETDGARHEIEELPLADRAAAYDTELERLRAEVEESA